jgi:1-acyl-sn-glycerol-3-phosphate acyltransferase
MTPNQSAALILILLSLVWLAVIVRDIRRFDGGWFVYFLYMAVRLYSGICFRVRTNRRCPFPLEGPAIVVANHRSPLDPMFLSYNIHVNEHPRGLFRVIHYLMVDTYYDIHPFVSKVCRSMDVIPVSRTGKDMGPIKQAVRTLKGGNLIGIFPEAGINLKTGLLPADPGVGWLALTAKCPVYPVFIHNAPVGHTMVQPFFNFQPVRLSYGDPMTFEEFHSQKKNFELSAEVTLKIMHEVGRLGGEDMTGYRCLEPGEERHTS